jgi:23S rRNA pseudouridine955/2504/2580 synthase
VKLPIDEDDAGRRVDAVVRRRLGLPRSLVMKSLRTGRIRVNEARARPDAHVALGDVVEVDDALPPASRAPARRPARPAPAPAPDADALADVARRIVYRDPDVVIFDKPAGMVAHAGSGHAAGAVDLLCAWLRTSARTMARGRATRECGVAEDATFRPALAHRLDRDTSGLVVLATTAHALRRLAASIRGGQFEKSYVALVRGVPDPPEGEIRAALRKEQATDGRERMVVVPEGSGGLASVTRYRTLRTFGRDAALLALTPETGRTHQLRAHLAHLGHPIALDPRYGDPAFDRRLRERTGLRRLFLHAARLAFPHPRTGARVQVEAPLAADLKAAVARLEAGGTGRG